MKMRPKVRTDRSSDPVSGFRPVAGSRRGSEWLPILEPHRGALIQDAIDQLAAAPIDHAAAERERLTALVTDLDGKIRRTSAQVSGGLIEEDDARAINAPLIEQRERARLQLAALPSAQPPPAFDEVDPDAFRTAVREAWHDRPLTERREALDRVLDEVRLSPGGVHITYGVSGYHGHDPYGPPYAPMSDHVPSLSQESEWVKMLMRSLPARANRYRI